MYYMLRYDLSHGVIYKSVNLRLITLESPLSILKKINQIEVEFMLCLNIVRSAEPYSLIIPYI